MQTDGVNEGETLEGGAACENADGTARENAYGAAHKNAGGVTNENADDATRKNTDGSPRRVLIAGAGSYIGTSFARWAEEHYPERIKTKEVSMHGDAWCKEDFSKYDAVLHVAGIAHADTGSVTEEQKKAYYDVNTRLAIDSAKKAKGDGASQFILMSSIIVYGNSGSYGRRRVITRETRPRPASVYGDSKWRADKGVRALRTEGFHVAAVRSPMVYGSGCKGNYPTLERMAKKLPVFPDVKNERSMIYIDNLCEFLCQLALDGRGGVFFPQNPEAACTSDLVREIAALGGGTSHSGDKDAATRRHDRKQDAERGRARKGQKACGQGVREHGLRAVHEQVRLGGLPDSWDERERAADGAGDGGEARGSCQRISPDKKVGPDKKSGQNKKASWGRPSFRGKIPNPTRAGVDRKGGSREFAPSMPPAAEIDPCVQIDFSERKRILVVGKGSYIGESFREWMGRFPNCEVDVLDARGRGWRDADFSGYDALLDVAGIAHVKETRENRRAYYEVNRDLAVALAKKAKREGVPQFVYLSSMSVYGLSEGRITADTPARPSSAYGRSKAEAEILLWKMNSDDFAVQVVRPPMVYGRGCKGNYQTLRRFALMCKVFPSLENERSMIYIDNLSSALRGVIHYGRGGVYFPQNPSYMQTREMVSGVAALNGRRVALIGILNPIAKMAARISGTFRKVFGTLVYDQGMNVPDSWLAVRGNMESLEMTESQMDFWNGENA